MRAATLCAEERCPRLAVERGRCAEHQVPHRPGRPRTPGSKARATRVRRRDRNRCQSCGQSTPPGSGAVDHRIPLVDGGPDTEANLWLLCPDCHQRKTSAEARARARGGEASVR